MRTTITLDEDVVSQLKRVQRRRRVRFKQAVNDALREGLANLERPTPPAPFRTRAVSLGALRLAGLDDVAEALELAEGERLR